jgi:hypothetical protein
MISVPKIGEDLRAGEQAFLAQIAKAHTLGFQSGQRDAFNEVLKWATANQEELKRSGLAESLLRLCGI